MRPLQNLQFEHGEVALIQCIAVGTPDTVAKWYRNNALIEPSENYAQSYDYQTGVCSLSIGATSPEDSGQYTCIVSNYAGTESSNCMVVVRGVVEPQVSERRQSVIRVGRQSRQDIRSQTPLRLGQIESTQIESASNQESQAFLLRQQQHVQQIEQGLQIYQQQSQVQRVQQQQTTTVNRSQVSSSVSTVSSGQVQAPFTKPVLIDQLQDVQAQETSTALFECRVRGHNLRIQWFKGIHEITNVRNRKTSYDEVSNVARLFIANVSREDIGEYTCQASNELGGVSNSARLTLKGKYKNKNKNKN